jgi:Predicted protease with the C-terminal PDZ domain
LLWIFEGFTSYYDDLILLRSGVINQESYIALLKAQIDRYLQNPGRFIQSVSESSFDAWVNSIVKMKTQTMPVPATTIKAV